MYIYIHTYAPSVYIYIQMYGMYVCMYVCMRTSRVSQLLLLHLALVALRGEGRSA